MQVGLRPVQTFFEFIVAGALVSVAGAGLLFSLDAEAGQSVASLLATVAADLGSSAVLVATALLYGVGVLVDDLTRVLLEDRALDRIKRERLQRFEQRWPGVFEGIADRDGQFGPVPELERFGVMRMYTLHRSQALYAEVTNQVARLRLGRVIFSCLVIVWIAMVVVAARTLDPLPLVLTAVVAALAIGAFRGMRARFERYVRAVERSFLVLGITPDEDATSSNGSNP